MGQLFSSFSFLSVSLILIPLKLLFFLAVGTVLSFLFLLFFVCSFRFGIFVSPFVACLAPSENKSVSVILLSDRFVFLLHHLHKLSRGGDCRECVCVCVCVWFLRQEIYAYVNNKISDKTI